MFSSGSVSLIDPVLPTCVETVELLWVHVIVLLEPGA